jgi:hypothetical protein
MLTIIHGSDTTQSRKYFSDEKNKTKDAILLDADQVNLTDLTQIFDGGGLFGETKYLFIEQLFTKRKKSADFKELLSFLEKHASEHTIIIWEGKELDRSSLNVWKKATVKDFKLAQTLFQFLDGLKPQNTTVLINLFHKTIATTEPEMVFFMLVRQIRLLLALSSTPSRWDSLTPSTGKHMSDLNSDVTNPIEELVRIAPWQKSKLENQAKLFKLTHLLKLYDKLFQIELGQKTGTLPFPLVCAIDFFLLDV